MDGRRRDGATAAWIIGGPLIQGPGWQWVFWLNVPIGLAIAVLATRLLPESRDATAPPSFDIAGAASVTAALALLIYTVVEAPTQGWGSPQILLLFAVSVGLLGSFVVIERRASHPLIPRRIARSRRLLAANLGLGGAMATIYGMCFILALYGQQVLGWSALKLGFAGCVLPLSVAVGAQLGQVLVTRRGPRPVTITAMIGLAAGLLVLSGVPARSDYVGHMLPALLLFGPAFGAAITSYSITTLSGVAPTDAGLASGLNNTFECIFGALGTAIMGSVAATKTSSLRHSGTAPLPALNGGFKLAFAAAIAFPAVALLASITLRSDDRTETATALEPATALEMSAG